MSARADHRIERGPRGAAGAGTFADELAHLLDEHDVGLAVEPMLPGTVAGRAHPVALVPAAQGRDRHLQPFGDHADGVSR